MQDHHHHHPLSPTTHTLEMDQITALNAALLARAPESSINAADLGLAGTPLLGAVGAGPTLAAEAVPDHLCFDGDPEYPYIYAHFRHGTSGTAGDVVALHTHAIRELSRLLHLRGLWGTGSTERPPT
jgi:hypothetical protein